MTSTVLTCLYAGDNPHYFRMYLEDIYSNSCMLDSVIIVVDGPVTLELNCILDNIRNDTFFTVITLPENKGLVNALNVGLVSCTSEYCIRLDPDDRMSKDRVAKINKKFLTSNADVVFNGVKIIDDEDVELGIDSPNQREIFKRNPFYHSGSAYKLSVVRNIGLYRDFKAFEDYDLWLRIIRAGLNIEIIAEPLSSFRVSRSMVNRRRGLDYMLAEIRFLKVALIEGNLKRRFLFFWMLRILSRLLPSSLIVRLRSVYFDHIKII